MLSPMRRRHPTRRGAVIVLGAGYGMCIFCGLRAVEHLAPAHELGGLAIPYLLAPAGPPLGYPAALLLLALAAPLTTLLLAVQGRRHPPAAQNQKKPTQNS